MLSLGLGLGLPFGGRAGVSVVPTPWTPVNAFGQALITWLDRNDSASITDSSGISAWADKSGRTRVFSQATSGNRPTLTSTEGQWDGTNDILTEPAPTLTYVSDTIVPDGRGGKGVGEAFSLTHICPDPVTGGFVLANDGRGSEPENATSCTPSLMFVDASLAKIREVNLSDGRSVQGVCFDPADTNFVWTARPTAGANAGAIERVNATTGAVSTTIPMDVNGLAVVTGDPTGEGIYFAVTFFSSPATLRLLSADGTEIRTADVGLTGGVDGLWWDEENGWLWAQANSVTYILSLYGRRLATFPTGAAFSRGEGACRVGSKIYITHNGSYHTGAVPDTSRVFEYDVANLSAVGRDGAHYALFWLGNHGGALPTANRVLFGHENPLSGQGLSLYSINSPVTGLSLFANTGPSGTGEQASAPFTVALNERSVWTLIVNAVEETATLYRNGTVTAEGSVSLANITSGRVVAGRQTIGGAIESGSVTRHSRLRLTQMFEYLGETAITTEQRQKAEAYIARNDPAGTALANLDEENPYLTGDIFV